MHDFLSFGPVGVALGQCCHMATVWEHETWRTGRMMHIL